MSIHPEEFRVFTFCRRSWLKRDLIIDKGAVCPGKHGIYCGNQIGFRPPVLPEGVPERRISRSVHVGKDISPTEAVYGLFWIANKKEDALFGAKNLLENSILNGIRVLEFIYQGSPKFHPHGSCKGFSPLFLQGSVQPEEKIIKKLDISLRFSSGKLIVHVMK
ncbi:hypothetical protein ES703_49671 [subsurface metagenome]